jgi:subtilisin family serine protease
MRTVPRRSSIALLVAVAAAVAAPAAASAAEGQVIVKYAAGAGAHDRFEARDDAGVVRDEALPLPRTELVTPQPGTSVAEAVADLERSPDVAYAEPDRVRHAFDLYPDEARLDANTGKQVDGAPFTNLWALHNTGQALAGLGGSAGTAGADIDAPAAWDVTTGSANVTVAVVDSGVDRTHPDLFANLVPGYDFAYDDADPTDYYGHGTHVAGTIAARGNNGVGVTGVAWQTSLMPVQALDAKGSGTITDIVDAYDYAASHGAEIVNASLGGEGFSDLEYEAIKRAKDTLFVVAAGNESADDDLTPSYPCAYELPNLLCVAATDNTDRLAGFSNYGRDSVDIAAPGVRIFSTTRCNAYGYLSGTSMATPQVSGAAALVLAASPQLTPEDVRARLIATADPLSPDDVAKIGGGRLDVARALGVTPPGSGADAISTSGGPTAATVTFAAPRASEPQPPAPVCPAAPVRTTAGTGGATPATPVASTPSTAPATARKPAPARTVTPVADRTAPTVAAALAARGALRALLAGRLRVSTTASERARVRLELRLDPRTARELRLTTRASAVVIATGSATLTKAGTKAVTLRLTARARRALSRARRLKATLRATATDAGGNRRTRTSARTLTR